jgi:catechol 2,3-dioxygenase-like lactoylglutathione lyase family enzyme
MMPQTVAALVRFSLTTADAAALAAFYQRAFDCRQLRDERREGVVFEQLMSVRGGARALTLALGAQEIELLQFDVPGQPYPRSASASDLGFQHFAIVVADMQRAYRQLCATPGWAAISRDGPQQLPQSAGGVTAFKFRDPEGHPLELLHMPALPATPPALFGGIDHSAISVADTLRSVDFYAQIGLRVCGGSFNGGVEQERLDDVAAPRVEVTALSPPQVKPHLELLCYRRPLPRPCEAPASNDITATRLIFGHGAAATGGGAQHALHRIDPDGHHVVIE